MNDVWIIRGAPDDSDAVAEAYGTETLAYAAYGRLVAAGGYVDADWRVTRLDLQLDPVAAPVAAERPGWLDTAYPTPFVVADDGDGSPAVQSGGRHLFSISPAGTSTAQDEELAAYIVALINAGRP